MAKPQFKGKVKGEWLKDGRKMKLMEDFQFVDKAGKTWAASEGSVIDGASIPKFFWTSIGPPFVGKYRRATVLHDVACVERSMPHEQVHKMFLEAMLADKTPKRLAKKMYFAVSSFGPKWDAQGNDLDLTPGEEDFFYNP